MQARLWIVASLLWLSALAPAQAQTGAAAELEAEPAAADADPGAPGAPGPLVLGAEVGAIFPQPFTELGTHVAFGLEAGYALPFLKQQLEAMFAVGYTPPARSFSLDRYEGEVVQQELTFSLGPRYRFLERQEPWNVTAALGMRLFLLRSTSNGSADGESFAEFSEKSTQIGLFLAAGGEYRLGPGALFLDLDFGWSALPHDVTGDGKPKGSPSAASTGNIATTLGYRLFLL